MNFVHSFTSALSGDSTPSNAIKGKVTKVDPREPRLVDGFYTLLDFTAPVANCMIFSAKTAALLDYKSNQPNDYISSKSYYAMNYGGYQFGQWNGQLGDGRTLHHGDIRNTLGQLWDISIKGVGKTPFSRHGDGLLTLKSAVREYLGLEYLAALGIPTTRSLAVYSTGKISRDFDGKSEVAAGGIIARISPSWIRFGQFEIFYLRGDYKRLLQLTDYVIDTFYPKIVNMVDKKSVSMKNKYALFFEQVVKDSAYLVARWQAAGFVHGILNTDNLSIHGLSLHLGPFAFLDVYDPSFAPNLTDVEKRFRFESQPDVMYHSLCGLGNILSLFFVSPDTSQEILKKWVKSMSIPLISSLVPTPGGRVSLSIDYLAVADMINREIMSNFNDLFLNFFIEEMSMKLGFQKRLDSDYDNIITPLLQLLADSRADYTYFFRLLGQFSTIDSKFESQFYYDYKSGRIDEKKSPILHLLLTGHANFIEEYPKHPIKPEDIVQSWKEWCFIYRKRLLSELEESSQYRDSIRCKRMNLVNPKYSLKSWILSEICDSIDNPSKCISKLEQAKRILINDIWGTETDLSTEDRRVSNAWSRSCYDKPYNQFNLNCP